MTATVDVVIVTANTEALVLNCVAALRGEAVRTVTVVDNGGQDTTATTLRGRHPEVQLIELEEPVGFGTACNLGAAAGNSEIVLLLNSDIVTTPGAVARLCDELAARAEAVAAAGRLVDPGTGATQRNYRPHRFPTVASLAVQAFGVTTMWPGNPVTAHNRSRWLPTDETVRVEQPAGACLAVRRTTFESIGGFDQGYWFWYEDVDLAQRLNAVGEILWVPSAAFEHVGGASFSAWSAAARTTSRIHGLVRYLTQHGTRRQRLVVGALVGTSEFLRSLFCNADERRAHRAGARLLGELWRTALHDRSTSAA
jgi:GT2 family glycosyltransferase